MPCHKLMTSGLESLDPILFSTHMKVSNTHGHMWAGWHGGYWPLSHSIPSYLQSIFNYSLEDIIDGVWIFLVNVDFCFCLQAFKTRKLVKMSEEIVWSFLKKSTKNKLIIVLNDPSMKNQENKKYSKIRSWVVAFQFKLHENGPISNITIFSISSYSRQCHK